MFNFDLISLTFHTLWLSFWLNWESLKFHFSVIFFFVYFKCEKFFFLWGYSVDSIYTPSRSSIQLFLQFFEFFSEAALVIRTAAAFTVSREAQKVYETFIVEA